MGLRRGRRDADTLKVGDALDWWRVEECVEGSEVAPARVPDLEEGEYLLRLRAEMKAPGLAWLELRVSPRPGGALYRQRAIFLPRGLAGHAYWWVIAPFHVLVFGGMERRIVAAAELAEGAWPAGRARRGPGPGVRLAQAPAGPCAAGRGQGPQPRGCLAAREYFRVL